MQRTVTSISPSRTGGRARREMASSLAQKAQSIRTSDAFRPVRRGIQEIKSVVGTSGKHKTSPAPMRKQAAKELAMIATRSVRAKASRAKEQMDRVRQQAAMAIPRRRAGLQPARSTLLRTPFRRRLDKLQWLPDLVYGHDTSGDGSMLIRARGSDPWAAGSALTATLNGRASCTMQIARMERVDGLLCVGICDESSTVAWGLHPSSGRLIRCTRNAADGSVAHRHQPYES